MGEFDKVHTGGGVLGARRQPTQRRSRERVERILAATTELLEEGGSDALKMSEVAQRAQIPIGSLYQYFPDKTTLIAELAERYNTEGRACVGEAFEQVEDLVGVVQALNASVDGFYEMYVRYPAMRDIWGATQADKALRGLDEADIAAHAAILSRKLGKLGRSSSSDEDEALLLMHLLAAGVRLAMGLEPQRSKVVLDGLKRMLAGSRLLEQ